MEIRVRVKGSVVVLDINGAIDVNAASLVEVVGQCIRDGYSDVICNFEDVSSVDYMGISVIVIAYKEVLNNEGRMKFLNLPLQLKSLLSVTGLDRSIEIYASEELALNSFKEDKIIENIQKLQLRRRFKRLFLDIKVEIRPKYGNKDGCLNVDILNLSAVGAFIFGCDKFKLNEEVVLDFKMPPKSEEMILEAKVVWLCDKQVQPQLYPGMGVVFHNISASEQEKLIAFIEKNLPLMSNEE